MPQIDQTPALLEFKQVKGITWKYNFRLIDQTTGLPINLSTYNIVCVIENGGAVYETLFKDGGITLAGDNLGFTVRKDWVSFSTTGVATPALSTLPKGVFDLKIILSGGDGVEISPIFIKIEVVNEATSKVSTDAGLIIHDITISNGFAVSVNAFDVQNQLTVQNQFVEKVQKNPLFKSTIDSFLPDFLIDVQFTGLNFHTNDTIHVDNVRRAKAYTVPTPFNRHLLRFAVNGVVQCYWFRDNYVEPTADSFGNIFDTIQLIAEGSTGVTAIAKVNWAALATNTEFIYNSTSDRLKARLSEFYLNPKLPTPANKIGRGTSNIDSEIARLDKSSVFQGSEINASVQNFLVDIQFSNLVVPATTKKVHIYNIWRAKVNGSSAPRWVVDIAIDDVRFCQFLADSYGEPAADAEGNIFDTINLGVFGSGTVTAKAIVNWAAIVSNTSVAYSGSTAVQALISRKKYTKALMANVDASGVAKGATTVAQAIDNIEKNAIFAGDSIDSFLRDFIVDVRFQGANISTITGDQVHVDNVRRAKSYVGPPAFVRHLVRFALNGSIICSWFRDGYVEPTPDAKGNIFDTLTFVQEGSNGITATVKVNWAAVTTNTEYIYNATADRKKALLSPSIYRSIPKDALPVSSSTVTRGTSNIDSEIARLDKSSVFQGSEINASVQNFLVDIQFSGLVVPATTKKMHLYNIWRAKVNGSSAPRWVVDIAIDDVRFCQFLADSYAEPAADAEGNVFDTINLGVFGSGTVTAKAIVNWAAIVSNTSVAYSGSTAVQALISRKKYTKALTAIVDATGVAKGATSVAQAIDNIEKNAIFVGDSIDSYLRDFLVELNFTGANVSALSSDQVHIDNVRRAKNYVTYTRSLVRIAISGTVQCYWFRDNYVEPVADAKGNIFDTISLIQEGTSGVTATAKVNWAALATNTEFNYNASADRKKALLSRNVYLKTGNASAVVKSNLPSTASPRRLYTSLNDIDPRNVIQVGNFYLQQHLARQYSLSLYIDHFLKAFPLNTLVNWDETMSDKIRIFSQRKGDSDIMIDHSNPSTTYAKTMIINGSSAYNNRTINFTQYSTLESIAKDKKVFFLKLGDSTVVGLGTEVGVPAGNGTKSWGVTREQWEKMKIDYLYAQGYSQADIQADNISNADKERFKFVNIGTKGSSEAIENFMLNYRGITKTFSLKAEGIGGWNYGMYINKPLQMFRSQGAWDALGLGNGTGTDYVYTNDQVYLLDRTAWNPAGLVDTPAMRAWCAGSPLFFTGTTRQDYVDKFTAVSNNPINLFYDADSTRTITDADGLVVQVRFSILKYLSRWRTMNNNGDRLLITDSTKGSLVNSGNINNNDVALPTHIIMQSCQNDVDVQHFGKLAKAFADAIKAEYSTNSLGSVFIGLSIIDGAGTYFPKRYPEIPYCSIDEGQRAVHDNNLQRLLAAIPVDEDANRIFVLSHTFVLPTAKSIIWRAGNSPEYDLTGEEEDMNFIASRTNPGIKGHINAVGHRVIGIHEKDWILYTLRL